jgi:hypothetical protein
MVGQPAESHVTDNDLNDKCGYERLQELATGLENRSSRLPFAAGARASAPKPLATWARSARRSHPASSGSDSSATGDASR